jgi:hypothetical protein
VGSSDHADDIPDDVRALLLDRISGFESLELLLLFCADPGRAWTARTAAEHLRLPINMVEPALEALVAHELVGQSGDAASGHVFHPATDALRATCETLSRLYADDRTRVIMLMSRLAFERIRRTTARAFADAFRIRRPAKRGDPDA